MDNYCKSVEEVDFSKALKELQKCGALEITPPTKIRTKSGFTERSTYEMHLITTDSLKGYNRAVSIKPGNIKLNFKKLMSSIPSVMELSMNIATKMTYDKIFAALSLCKYLKDMITVEITKDQAFVIVALWKNCDQHRKIEIDKGLLVVNALYAKYGEPEINKTKYNLILDSLEKIKCLTLKDGNVELVEQISKKYMGSM